MQHPSDASSREGVAIQPPTLEVRHLSKTFGATRALSDVDMTVLPGEVHGLLGENGSGKSTLIKILAGYHEPDPGGSVSLHGVNVTLPLPPGEFRRHGLAFVHQDLGLIPSLTVLENLSIGAIAAGKGLLKPSAERRRAREAFARFNLDLDLDTRTGELLPVDRALLALVRATQELRTYQAETGGHGLFILDEPTVFLPAGTAGQLHSLIRAIANEGSSVLFVSHDLAEVSEVTDRITVLRDGKLQGTVTTADASNEVLVEMILGRVLAAKEGTRTRPRAPLSGTASIALEGVTGDLVRDVSFEIRAGEVLGLAGLMGSGIEEIPYLIVGATDSGKGTLRIGTKEFDLKAMRPYMAVESGVAMLPADRQRDSAIQSLTVEDNILMPVLERYTQYRILPGRKMRRAAGDLLQDFDVRPNDPELNISALSGGNQQKALLAKWLQTRPALLILEKPTQGIDIGAREQLYVIANQIAESGTAVLVSETDYEALERMCSRVLIFNRGRITNELTGGEITKERIVQECLLVQ